MKRQDISAFSLLALPVLLLPACTDDAADTPPQRIRLFDLMDRATVEMAPAPEVAPATVTVADWDFAERSPARLWLAPGDAPQEYRAADPARIAIAADLGMVGGGLSIGPVADGTGVAAVVVLPARGFARCSITGRVRLDRNAQDASAATRETLRVIEHRDAVDDPAAVAKWLRREAPVHRVSRRRDPSGWDRFAITFVTRFPTASLELQLRHQDDGSGRSITRFDDVSVQCTPLAEADLWAHLREVHAPRDGQEASTPWRIRAALPRALYAEEEVRDAILLPPPATLGFPVRLPPREARPCLRFHYGMLPEAFDAPGDGARIAVRFQAEGEAAVEIGTVDFDPKQNQAQRSWQSVEFDLTAVGGGAGVLSFESRDVAGSDADPLDAVILGTPRIEPRRGTPDAWNLLLIGVDTLRADRMSAFGYSRPTTPNITRLAEHGIVFREARAQAPWTLPSFASILTSLHPSAHGAGRGGHQEWTGIDPGTTSLAEVLSRVGYETQGIVANGMLSPLYGLDQGFEGYRSRWSLESVDEDVGSVCEFIDGHQAAPWHLFWHIMDPHLPYTTEATFRNEFTDANYVGQFSRRKSVPFEVLAPLPGRGLYAHEGPPPAPELSEGDRRFVSDAYDAEVAEMDAAVGRVVDALKRSGQWDRTIVALIADHGEGLGEHGHYHHGYTLYDDQVHVPMLLCLPDRERGEVIDAPVSAIDLAPTLLAALGIPRPDGFQGRDVLGPARARPQPCFIECPTYDSSAQKAWIDGAFKYLHDPVLHTAALFDLANDPGETRDVAPQHPEIVARARADLANFRWEQLQRGRFHLRIVGRPGQRLSIEIRTEDLFDANFATRPAVAESDARLDLERRNLVIDTTLDEPRLELLFWCRGRQLSLDIRLDGEALEVGTLLGEASPVRTFPVTVDSEEVPTLEAARAPAPVAGQARLWRDAGAATRLPELPSPGEIEVLKQLGYAR